MLWRFPEHLHLAHSLVGRDWHSMHLPDALYAERALRAGHWPAWAPHLLGGTPLMGVATKPFTYPLFLAAAGLMGAAPAMNVLLLLHALVGGLGVWALGRNLGLRQIPALFGSACFLLLPGTSNGFVAIPFGTGYALAWWPWTLILWLEILGPSRPRPWAPAGLAALLALQWHAGGEPTLAWFACFALSLAVPRVLRRGFLAETSSILRRLIITAACLFGLGAVRLLPELSWLEASGRAAGLSAEAARDLFFDERQAPRAGLPRFWFGARHYVQGLGPAVAWILATCTLLALADRRHLRTVLGLALASGAGLVLASGAYHDWFHGVLPGYDLMRRHTRFILMTDFGFVLLCALGAHRLANSNAALRWCLGSSLALALAWQAAQLADARKFHMDPALQTAHVALELAPVLADPAFGRLHHPAHREQHAWISLDLETTSGALGGPGSGNGRLQKFLPEFSPPANLEKRYPRVLDALGVRYIATYAPLAGEHLVCVQERKPPAEVPQDGVLPVWIYRRAHARARAMLVHGPTLVVGDADHRESFLTGRLRRPGRANSPEVFVEVDFADLPRPGASDAPRFGAAVFPGCTLEDPRVQRFGAAHPEGRLRAPRPGNRAPVPQWIRRRTKASTLPTSRIQRGPGFFTFDVRGEAADGLLLAELCALHPGWSAEIDGEPTRLYSADGVATWIPLPAGARRVHLTYRTPGLALGAWITAGTVCLLAAWLFVRRRP